MKTNGLKATASKILAGFLSLIMVVSVIPLGTLYTAFAAVIDSYSVRLTDGKDAIELDEVIITVRNKKDAKKVSAQKTKKGIATFNKFIEENETYIVSVEEITGYEKVEDFEITTAAGESNKDVALTAIGKIKISGKIVNEKGEPYSGAVVSLTGYYVATTATNDSGEYFFEVYGGKNYTIKAKAKEDKYEEKTTNITNVSKDYVCEDLKFTVKQFNISADTAANGKVLNTGAAEYGTDKTVSAEADEGYRIGSYTVDGLEQAEAKGQKTYEYTFKDIKKDHIVKVSFVRQTYKIQITVGKNGKVSYLDGTAQEVAGGSVNIEKIFNESTDPENPTKIKLTAAPNDGYCVSKVIADGKEETFTDNKEEYTKEFIMTEDHSFVVEFNLNKYTAEITNGANGSANFADGESKITVNHGDSAEITIIPNDGYNLEDVKVNGDSALKQVVPEEDGSFKLVINNITKDTKVEISYSEIIKIENNGKVNISTENCVKSITGQNTVKYIYKNNAEVNITLKKDSGFSGIKINGEITGFAFGTEKYTYKETKIITKIEVFKFPKWHDITEGEVQIIIDKDAPVVETAVTDVKDWTNSNKVSISGTVSDTDKEKNPSSGLSHIVWSKDSVMSNEAVLAETANKVIIDSDGKYVFDSVEGEQNSTYYIYAVDLAGNVSAAKKVQVKIDRTNPTVTKFEYSTEKDSVITEFIKFLTFGTISSKTIYVTVTGSDANISSGLKEITLYKGKDKFETKKTTGNSATFKLTEKDLETADIIYASVTDNAGNVSEKKKPAQVESPVKNDYLYICSKKPGAEITPAHAYYTDADGKLWYYDNTELSIKVFDYNAGIRSVEIKLNGESLKSDSEGSPINKDFSENYIDEKIFVINTAQKPLSGENTIEVIVTNNAGVKNETAIQKVYIDKNAPDIDKFEVKKGNGSAFDKTLNFLTFGVFFNEKVEISVTASDSEGSSGIKNIELFSQGNVISTAEPDENNTATFELPLNAVVDEEYHFYPDISAKATDNTDNTTEYYIEMNSDNSNIVKSGLMIETIKPEITVEFPEAATDKNDDTAAAGDWYNSDVEFVIKAEDADAGLRNVLITINDKELCNENHNSTKINSMEYKINTKDADIAEDGSYTLKVKVTDNAGNVSDAYTKTIFKDVDNPYITGFDFAPDEYIEGSEEKATVEITDYGFYFRDDTKVTVYAKDDIPTAGIKSITYYTVDKDSGKSEEKTALVNKDNCIDFVVNANFKGQIYAKATDNVLNTVSEFSTPDSAIVESPEKHEQEEHIAFSKDSTEFKTQDGTELYAQDVPVTLIVTDTYSGIRNIEWEVAAPYDTEKNQSGKVTVNNDKTFAKGSEQGWKQTVVENNLVTEMQKTITVSNNSNNIVVTVKMSDRAGNTSEEKLELSIDKTTPVIEVKYDNNEPDEDNKDIFKQDRTAEIKITERNFSSKDVVHKITNTDGTIPMVSAWEEHKNTEKPDETYYTASVTYAADGDYTFDISYSDLADNAAEKFEQHMFTIDKTLPVVNVSYDNNNVLNGNYYKEDRTATITITEHNFDPSRVEIVGNASDNGTSLGFPAASEWTTDGDTHTATINYASDAKYTFDIEFSDMAGNAIADYETEEFFVDKTAPTLEISGVADKSANNGVVAPVIRCSDTNFNKDAVNINLSGSNNGKVNYAVSSEDIANGQNFRFADFAKIKKVDDIYTLLVRLTDMAGNETTDRIVFSANRFGSVYSFADFLNAIGGKYTNSEQDIVFTETNVDALDRESIKLKLIKNGTPADLKEGEDYTITESGGNGQWCEYKYVVNKDLFADDGNYRLAVYSMDAAGNVNENIDETKEAEIAFGIDSTNPVIVPIDLEKGKQYPVEVKNVKAEIKDNLVLESVKIYLNGNEIEYEVDGETYMFDIPESNDKQNVEFVAVDAAGNEYKLQVDDLLISTNIFVRWFNNTPLFIGSIIGVVVIAVALTAFIVFGKKKKKEEEK